MGVEGFGVQGDGGGGLGCVPVGWCMSDWFWGEVRLVVECFFPGVGGGRVDLRRVMDGIVYRLLTGCAWRDLPGEFGASSTVYGWFERFARGGLFAELWGYLVAECDELDGTVRGWRGAYGIVSGVFVADGGCMGRVGGARGGGSGCVFFDGEGWPVGAVVAGGDVDCGVLLTETIDASVIVGRGARRGIEVSIPLRGREGMFGWREGAVVPSRFWAVDHALVLGECLGVARQAERKDMNYLAMVQLACVLLWQWRYQWLVRLRYFRGYGILPDECTHDGESPGGAR